jgi:hypothetical protein
MAKDQRLYMTFPNDFWMHPKVAPLSVEAKWAFVEMNGYSRMQDLDGSIPSVMALRLWSSEVLAELVASHPERPLVMLDGDTYVIRDYDKHQQTTADREALSQVRSMAGKRGRAKQLADTSPASDGQVPGQIRAETESETESETSSSTKKRSAAKRGTRIDSTFIITNEMRDWARGEAPLVNVDSKLSEWIDYWSSVPGEKGVKLDWVATWRNGMRKQQEFAQRDAPATRSPRRVVSGRVQ